MEVDSTMSTLQPAQALPAFTCITCRVSFHSADLQRDHFQSSWHRYNLKRKISALPPISLEIYDLSALQLEREQRQLEVEEARLDTGRPGGNKRGSKTKCVCDVCHGKSFSSESAFDNHLTSQTHLRRVEKQSRLPVAQRGGRMTDVEQRGAVISDQQQQVGAVAETVSESKTSDEEDTESSDGEDLPPYDTNECLFCSKIAENITVNVEHMLVEHGFYIPDAEACVDIEGLIEYLGHKSSYGKMCLWCNAANFLTRRAVQQHMVSKGHCMMSREEQCLESYADFYDFSLLDDDEDDDSDADQKRKSGSKKKGDDDELVAVDLGYELQLPSGRVAGHRSLKHIYQQSLKPVKNLALQTSVIQKYADKRQGKAIMPSMSQHLIEYSRKRGISLQDMALASMRKQNKARLRREAKLGIDANKLQRYFRDSTAPF